MKRVAITILTGAISFAVGFGLAEKHAKEAENDMVICPEKEEEVEEEVEDNEVLPLDYTKIFMPYALPETEVKFEYDTQNDRIYPVFFGFPETYTDVPGITTFRGNNFRNAAACGFIAPQEQKLYELYKFRIDTIKSWTGVGWVGQPGIIKWDDSVRPHLNINDAKRGKEELVEVIYGTMDGKVYFFDLEDGKFTRPPIVIGEPIKGSVTVDPRGYPLLYVGQGVNYKGRFGYHIYSLIDGEELFFINGMDGFAKRQWGAFDANPLFDVENDMMVLCGENGLVYSIKLNTNYDKNAGTIAVEPEISKYRYANGRGRLGIENSPAAFLNYLFFADNGGYLQCLDLNAMEPVWMRDVTDDTDATIVLEWDDDTHTLSLYTGCEVDFQGVGGYSYLRKINALNGELLWEKAYPCIHHTTNGGLLATPVLGKHDISNLVIFWVAKPRNIPNTGGILVALDKATGEIVWENKMPRYGWSSPVAMYTEDGESYIIVCDAGGVMYLIRGINGEIIDNITLFGNVEASPAVYNNTIVVGTRGQYIYGIEVR